MSEDPLMLSVSGLRGLVGRSLTPPVAARYGAAAGQWLKTQQANQAAPHVVMGRDSRPSGRVIELAAQAGLMAVGCRVTSLGIVTTPGVAIMTEHLNADGGMVITASHNPIIWNGIKTLRSDGVAPSPDQARRIIDGFEADQIDYAAVEGLGSLAVDASTHDVHAARVLAAVNTASIRDRKLKVVVDSVHGAGGPVTALLLNELGVELIHLYADPTGYFPHEPEPTRDNLAGLCQAVREHGADIGFAQDPDADRLAIVDDQGRYIGEEYTLVLSCLRLLERDDRPLDPVVATNLSTSRMIDDVAAQAGARVVRSPVGEANVAEVIRDHQAMAGGEGNGGIIWPKVVCVRDSLVGMALVLELLAHRRQPLSAIVDDIPRYAIIKDKVDIDPEIKSQYVSALRDRYSSEKIDLQDGVRVDWSDRWVHVRPSNTEPILRMIAESRDEALAREMIDEVRQVIGVGQEKLSGKS